MNKGTLMNDDAFSYRLYLRDMRAQQAMDADLLKRAEAAGVGT